MAADQSQVQRMLRACAGEASSALASRHRWVRYMYGPVLGGIEETAHPMMPATSHALLLRHYFHKEEE